MELSACEKMVLAEYARAIFHMRSQLGRRKLMPVFGAGLSAPLGLPNWDELVRRISEHSDVEAGGLNVQRGSNTSRTQMLFQHFRANFSKLHASGASSPLAARERQIRTRWFSVIRDCLYATPSRNPHPFLLELVPIIRKAPLTVNYNFDDCIEEALDQVLEKDHDRESRGYETVWEPSVQYRYEKGVIYHPNGFLPRNPQRTASSWLVLAEEAFADQLIDAQKGRYSTLLSHLYRYTALIVGMSLDDPTLKHLLRHNAWENPGHVHYYVSYRDSCDSKPGQLTARDIASRDSNFETYNLVTLFLSSEQIAALAKLLSMPDSEFAYALTELGLPSSFSYYLSGPVGVGKTSALSYFKSLWTFDEWIDPKPALLLKAADKLTDIERKEVDEWINSQFKRKNFLIGSAIGQLCLVDRSLLDPIAFAEGHRLTERAHELLTLYVGKGKSLSDGVVLLMRGDPTVLSIRTHQRYKDGSVEYIDKLQKRFDSLWGIASDAQPKGIVVVDTVDRSLHEVVRAISRVIHLEPYEEADLPRVLKNQTEA